MPLGARASEAVRRRLILGLTENAADGKQANDADRNRQLLELKYGG
jgi:hypothetical protein